MNMKKSSINKKFLSRRKFLAASVLFGGSTSLFGHVSMLRSISAQSRTVTRSKTQDHKSTYLKHSDIVRSWGSGDHEAYRKYGVNVWGWGIYWNSERISQAYSIGYRIVASLVNLIIRPSHKTNVGRDLYYNPVLRDTTCVDIAGDPITVPWWDREYGDGNRSFWHCTNQPLYREHIRRNAHNGTLSGANAINIDDAMGNAMVVRLPETGGCFCDACMKNFSNYLKVYYSKEELRDKGITDIELFDYRSLVRTVAKTREAYTEAFYSEKIPLQGDFKLFQTRAAASFLQELTNYIKEIAGYNMPVSANLAMLNPEYLIGAVYPDYYIIELNFFQEWYNLPLESFRIAIALGRKCACWPVGWNVDWIRRDGMTGLLKLWIASAYALGHNFMVPVQMWCSTVNNEMTFYDPPQEEFVPVYQFIKNAPWLFDGFEETPKTGLLYNNRARRKGDTSSLDVGWELFNRNIAYGLLLARDKYLPLELAEQYIDHFDLIIIPDRQCLTELDKDENDLVQSWLQSGKAKYWNDCDPSLLEAGIRIVNDAKVWAIPRFRKREDNTEWVIHLVHNDYSRETKSFGDLGNVVLELDPSLFNLDRRSKIDFHTPFGHPKMIRSWRDEGKMRIEVDMVDFWCILTTA